MAHVILDQRKKPIFSPIKGITIEIFGEKLKGNYGLETNIVSTLIYWIWLLCYGYIEDCIYLLE